jgi:hypothetical protein
MFRRKTADTHSTGRLFYRLAATEAVVWTLPKYSNHRQRACFCWTLAVVHCLMKERPDETELQPLLKRL